MGSSHDNGGIQPFPDLTRAGRRLPVIRRKQRGDSDNIRILLPNFFGNQAKGSAEMDIFVKHGKRTAIRAGIILLQIGELRRERDVFSAVPLMIIPDHDLDLRQSLPNHAFEHAEAERLKSYVRVIEILDRRLN
jgi:hypothetical protein